MIKEKYWEVSKKNSFRASLLIFIFLTILSITAILLIPGYLYFWIFIVLVALSIFLEWHSKNFAYRCPRCGTVFRISALENIIRPDVASMKYLKCPICRRSAWAEILRIKEKPVFGKKLLFEEQNKTGYEKGKG